MFLIDGDRARWVRAVLASFCIVMLAGETMAAQHPANCRGTVVMLRGGLGYWPDDDMLAKQLRRCGYRTYNFRPTMYPAAAALIKRQKVTGPIVIVGYSSGGDSACLLARQLHRAGIKVNTIVMVEPTVGVTVPGNVDYCWNLYESNPDTDHIPIFRGVPVDAESASTCIENIDTRKCEKYAYLRELTHLNMASSAEVQRLIVCVIQSRHGGG